jgi:hypothetical protein
MLLKPCVHEFRQAFLALIDVFVEALLSLLEVLVNECLHPAELATFVVEIHPARRTTKLLIWAGGLVELVALCATAPTEFRPLCFQAHYIPPFLLTPSTGCSHASTATHISFGHTISNRMRHRGQRPFFAGLRIEAPHSAQWK